MNRKKPVILCVDDDPVALDSLRRQIAIATGPHCLTEFAESGEEAIEVFEELQQEQYPMPIVISDQIMPGMKGDELLATIHERSSHTKTILLTGQASINDISRAVNHAHIFRFMRKPWTPDELNQNLRDALTSWEQEDSMQRRNRELDALNAKLASSRDRAEFANRTNNEFLSIAAHELRTPMMLVSGMAELLAETPLDQNQKEFVSRIRNGCSIMANLVNDLTDFTKMREGRLRIFNRSIAPASLLEQVRDLTIPLAREKHLEFDTKLDPSLPEYLSTDPLRIRQILINLITNAVKNTTKGWIELAAALDDDHSHVVYKVCDSGPGIPDESKTRIFEPFFQFSREDQPEYEGMGLGLHISRKLARLMHGNLEVADNPRGGSCFSLTLPLDPPESDLT